MSAKRRIEVFSAGCPACEETIALVNRIACPSCEVEVLDMHQPAVAAKANTYGIRSVPAVDSPDLPAPKAEPASADPSKGVAMDQNAKGREFFAGAWVLF